MGSSEATQSFDVVSLFYGFLRVWQVMDAKFRIYAKFPLCLLVLLLSSGMIALDAKL